jgi:hypothetical protein
MKLATFGINSGLFSHNISIKELQNRDIKNVDLWTFSLKITKYKGTLIIGAQRLRE